MEQTAALADGWLPVFYHPTKARDCWGAALDAGTARRDPARGKLDVYAGGLVGIGDGLEAHRDQGRPGIALYVGGMGARGKNFYNDIFASYGYREEAARIQDLYLAGEKQAAAAAVPKSFLEETTLVGPRSFVKERLAEYRESGVTALNVGLVGNSLSDRLKTLESLRALL